ncbi:uncharacterized protein LOC117102655 [Anneissia japonica]|uniref:uncharacterized protein LOC117102655 n=1 Tax=Anneissia japonica TaxID=1529436 RepID=UPI00142598DC|nr:uncharacterized protein LOC117102655 [Anneissia japonica]
MKKNHFIYNLTYICFDFQLSLAFLIHFLKYASNLDSLELWSHNIQYASRTLVTGTILNAVINDLDNANIKLELEILYISGNDLNDIDGTLLGKLFKIAPKLKCLEVRNCRLSGGTLRAMITECQNSEDTVCNSHKLVTGAIHNAVINNLDNANIKLELEKLDISGNDLNDIDGTLLGKLFKIAPKLKYLYVRKCRLSGGTLRAMITECQNSEDTVCNSHKLVTGAILNAVINDLDNANIKLELEKLDISGNDLNDIDGTLLGKLFKIAPKLKCLDVSKCRLSVGTLSAMITECQNSEDTVDLDYNDKMKNLNTFPKLSYSDINNCRMTQECGWMNTVLKRYRLILKDNNLSDIDGTSLADLFRVHCQHNDYEDYFEYYYKDTIFILSDYSLTFDNIEKLVESVSENITLDWESIDLSRINLSSISGITLARLFNICPDLKHIDMSYCSLSGRIVNKMIEECCRMNVVLNDIMLSLKGNDLSDIDGKSLAELVRVICQFDSDYYGYEDAIFSWSDYSLTAGNLEMLVESVGENITLNWEVINLSRINLSSISGKTLARLFKISPDLGNIDMSYCSLSGRIVNEMFVECSVMNAVLDVNMLNLQGNNLSDIDGKLLAEIIIVLHKPIIPFIWSGYFLTADNLEKLVESVAEENITLNLQVIDLSNINLSSISGRTLACLVKISPDLIHIDMSYCSLSGRIVYEMIEECCKMNVLLKKNMLNLWGNDISDISG